MNSNDLLKQILEEQKKTNELLKEGNEPIDIAINEPREKMNRAPGSLWWAPTRSFQSELAEPIFSADHIRTGTIKAEDLNEKLDKLSVLGTIDRYAAEQAEERLINNAKVSKNPVEFGKLILNEYAWRSSFIPLEQALEDAIRHKIEGIIEQMGEKSRIAALEKLFEEYKQSEDN